MRASVLQVVSRQPRLLARVGDDGRLGAGDRNIGYNRDIVKGSRRFHREQGDRSIPSSLRCFAFVYLFFPFFSSFFL